MFYRKYPDFSFYHTSHIGLSAYLLQSLKEINFITKYLPKQIFTDMVYIVDDDPNVRDGFMMLLKSAGYKCNCFESAEEFLKSYEPGANDLLILDMHLIGMNGCTLLEKMDKKGMHLPVIVVTAFDEPKYRECSRVYGAIAYLRKPVDGTALIDVIRYKSDISIPTNNNSLSINRSTL